MPSRPGHSAASERLHLNRGRYGGERIPVATVLDHIRREAARTGWRTHPMCRQGDHAVDAFTRSAGPGVDRPRRIYISAGIHGDEPAGTLAALELIRSNAWPADTELTLLPCLNPAGMDQNLRESPEGIDYNRDYREPQSALTRAHLSWLSGRADFDLAMLLHEDWEADGFYLYELAARSEESKASSVIDVVSRVCPILQGNRVDGWPAERGIVRPNADPAERPKWPEALFLYQSLTDLCYTFEAPSDYAMSTRVGALVTAVTITLSAGAATPTT